MKIQQYLRVRGLPQPLLIFLLLGMDCSRGMALSLPLSLFLQELFRSWDATEKPFKENAEQIPLLKVTPATSAAWELQDGSYIPWGPKGWGNTSLQALSPLPCSHHRITNSYLFKQLLLGYWIQSTKHLHTHSATSTDPNIATVCPAIPAFTYLLPGPGSGLVSRAQSCHSLKGQYPTNTQERESSHQMKTEAHTPQLWNLLERLQHLIQHPGHAFINH